MSLQFPNPCRSYDPDKDRVRFWGYDSAIEVSFFVESAALKQLCPDTSDTEVGILKAFDKALERIHEVAQKVYTRAGKGTYTYILEEEDF